MEGFIKLGKALGYPDCCIKYFCDTLYDTRKRHGVNWNGFIPCEEHAKLTLEEVTELLGRSPFCEPRWFSTREGIELFLEEMSDEG